MLPFMINQFQFYPLNFSVKIYRKTHNINKVELIADRSTETQDVKSLVSHKLRVTWFFEQKLLTVCLLVLSSPNYIFSDLQNTP